MTIIPIYDTLLLPEVTFYFKKEVIDGWNAKELKPSETIAFIMLKRDISIDEAKPEDFYPVGIAAKLENIDNEGNIRIRTMNRILFEDVRIKKTKILATIDERPEVDDFSVEERTEVFERLKAEYLKFVQNFQWGLWARGFILQWKNMNELACAMAGYFSITWEEKYSIIEADSLEQRYRLIETAAYEFMEKKPDAKILLIDKGKNIYKRKCPVNEHILEKCPINREGISGCHPACSITNGFGGAGAMSW